MYLRMKMFEALVESIALYGAEIWEWKKKERLARFKKVRKMDSRTG